MLKWSMLRASLANQVTTECGQDCMRFRLLKTLDVMTEVSHIPRNPSFERVRIPYDVAGFLNGQATEGIITA